MKTAKTIKTIKKKKTQKLNKSKSKTRYAHNGKNLNINCSPKDKYSINEYSCYTDESLIQLRDKWNMRHPDAIIETNNPKDVHDRLNNYLHNVCNKESCWLKQTTDFGELPREIKDSFAPVSPAEWKKNPYEWLSSVDIIKVMKQYEKAYKCFDFIGPSPIDFNRQKLYGECVWEELCNFNLKDEIAKGKFKIGIIFNTDPHYKPGQHWISMFINIKKKLIFFFDSTGDPPSKEIVEFVEKIKKQGNSLTPKINFKYDSSEGVEHQNGNTECGIYSLYFIVHMLEDKLSTNYLKTRRIKDEYVNKFRKVYFNESL